MIWDSFGTLQSRRSHPVRKAPGRAREHAFLFPMCHMIGNTIADGHQPTIRRTWENHSRHQCQRRKEPAHTKANPYPTLLRLRNFLRKLNLVFKRLHAGILFLMREFPQIRILMLQLIAQSPIWLIYMHAFKAHRSHWNIRVRRTATRTSQGPKRNLVSRAWSILRISCLESATRLKSRSGRECGNIHQIPQCRLDLGSVTLGEDIPLRNRRNRPIVCLSPHELPI